MNKEINPNRGYILPARSLAFLLVIFVFWFVQLTPIAHGLLKPGDIGCNVASDCSPNPLKPNDPPGTPENQYGCCTDGTGLPLPLGGSHMCWSGGGGPYCDSGGNGSALVNGACMPTHYNCSAGVLGAKAEYPTQYHWWCEGQNGGTNKLCVEMKSPGVCGATHNNCTAGVLGANQEYPTQYNWWCNSTSGGSNTLCTEMKVNGSCSFAHYNCSAGTSANNVNGSTSWTWVCRSPNGGTNASCSEIKPVVVSGSCSSTHYSCSAGTSGSQSDNATSWTWGCYGSGGGGNDSCSETKPTVTNGSCATTHYNCSAGNSANTSSGSTAWTWDCLSPNGGSNDSCIETKTVSGPDLTAGGISPTSVLVNSPTTFSTTISNIGNSSTGASFNNFFQVARNSDGSGILPDFGAVTASAISGGASAPASVNGTFSSLGVYYVRACVDKSFAGDAGTISEANENNNCGAWTSVAVTNGGNEGSGTFVDLVAGNVSPSTIVVNTPVSFSSSILNNGNVSTGSNFYNFFQISTAPNGGGTKTDLTSSVMSALSASGTGPATSPSHQFTSPGTYYIRACADKRNSADAGSITESSEDNNCSTGWAGITIVNTCPGGGLPPCSGGGTVNGACGDRNTTYVFGTTGYPAGSTFCSAGERRIPPILEPGFPESGGTVAWFCDGLNSGTNAGPCTARLALQAFTVTAETSSGGFITSSSTDSQINCGEDCQGTYEVGSDVTLQALPSSTYWKFDHWTVSPSSASSCSGTGPCMINNINRSVTVTASFVPRQFQYIEF
ncbi:MAG: hypothetical protein A2566_02080 [Candidatus Zambryskibacteria bacterium RIFOXYD1_FULL_40_13]|nr:MAG: Cell wall surface anchor family protein [Parcubacteria group bacterium GW2011_GWC1_39_12]KKR18955.1 MAG: Cell wall surface anchor family protein [Parcubacteria group bacterium GW2011_GWF1_39_37]KKR35490.1 MAG: Cell wall surface anchor family protein [Parcubacteria group bacterium GW2011_GWC2_40_10]KKR51979.1 MAG: Cell wall surface anchor family protein [Parcubacteria group bacterium GW2011_GWE1_40_20]KKR64797.1 MAG: Cell wall surface anchor family protein [Parcubacteria group bacterium 